MEIVHVHKIPKKEVYNRHEYIVQKCKGKTVLHVGACDHSENVKSKLKDGILLHDLVTKVAAKTVGIDINKEAISICEEVGITNIHYYDLFDPSEKNSEVEENNYDICILGELIEHVGDVRMFLVALQRLLGPETQVLISVPNAFWIKNIVSMLGGVENCNSDHWYYFSPTTLRRTVEGSGYEFVDFIWHGKGASKNKIPLKAKLKENLLWKYFPHLADGIIAIARLK